MASLWTIGNNPRRKRSRKHRTAAQRAATRRMIAANRSRRVGHNPRAAKKRGRRRSAVVVVNPGSMALGHHRRHAVSHAGGRVAGGAVALIRGGAIGAGGALAVDVAMGFVNGFLPVSMNSKLSADGSPNYLNYAVKGGLAVLVANYAGRLVGRENAHRMALGSMTIMGYELLRPLAQSILPASMSLGYYANMPTTRMTPATVAGLGNYQQIPGNTGGSGTIAMLRSPNAAARR